MNLKEKYGNTAMVAGASEGIGAAFSAYLAREGFDLVLIARRREPLDQLAERLQSDYPVHITVLTCDLAAATALREIEQALAGSTVDLIVYNAAVSYIGPFENNTIEMHNQLIQANITTPLNIFQFFGGGMLERGRGALIMMGSIAGFQGSGYITAYAASKAFDRILAEGLWYEWKDKGVDVIACCAGATSTPNYIKSNPADSSRFAPRVQEPEEVVAECFKNLGKQPSFVTGRGNRFASAIMQKLMPRKKAVEVMGDTTRKIYRIKP
jgi:short-subunit dehydrogenase